MATHMKLLINVATGDVTAEAVIIEGNPQEPGKYTERSDPDPKNYKEGSAVDLNATHAHAPKPLGMIFYTDPKFGCIYWIGGNRYEVC